VTDDDLRKSALIALQMSEYDHVWNGGECVLARGVLRLLAERDAMARAVSIRDAVIDSWVSRDVRSDVQAEIARREAGECSDPPHLWVGGRCRHCDLQQ
jgi:hypothetical protein